MNLFTTTLVVTHSKEAHNEREFKLLFKDVILYKLEKSSKIREASYTGADPEILKRGALYVGHHGWSTKKILGFRWSKKAKITLETKVFGETFLSVFSNFLHFNESLPMKSY